MAKDAKPAEEGVEAPPKKSKKLLIIILAAVLVVALTAFAAFLLLKKSDHAEDEDSTEETTKMTKKKDKKKEKETPPVFVNLEPFTVKLIPETGDQYLQVVLALELVDAHAEPDLKIKMPKVRNNITLLLSGKKASELLPKEGKEKLAEDLREEINAVIDPSSKKVQSDKVAEGPVKLVLFTSFIIQ